MCLYFRFLKMLVLFLTACLIAVTHAGCPMRPTVGQTSASRTQGDGGYRILISGQTNEYIPNAIHTISLQGLVPWKIIWKISELETKTIRSIAKNFEDLYTSKCRLLQKIDTKFQDRGHTRDCNNLHASRSRCTLNTRRTVLWRTSVISNCFRIPWPPLTRTALTRSPKRPISRNRKYEPCFLQKKKLIYFFVQLLICTAYMSKIGDKYFFLTDSGDVAGTADRFRMRYLYRDDFGEQCTMVRWGWCPFQDRLRVDRHEGRKFKRD